MGRIPPGIPNLLLGFLVWSTAMAASAAEFRESERQALLDSGLSSPELIATIEEHGWAPVLVSFAVPGVARREPDRAHLPPQEQQAITVACERILGILGPGNFRLRHRYRSLNAFAGSINAQGLVRLLPLRESLAVELDLGGTGQLLQAVPLVHLDAVQAQSLTGAGITVAVFDTGIDTNHPDLADDLVAERCFCSGGSGCCPNGSTDQSGAGSAEDDHGHGTNATGIVTSAGSVAPVGGAPDADIVAVKVLDSNNSFCCTGDLLAGLDYILNERPDVDLVNMSLATATSYAGDCDNAGIAIRLLTASIEELRSNGVLTFAASGDGGSATQMPAPACISSVISVGAVYDADIGSVSQLGCTDPTTAADQVPCWSSSSASMDLLAPGAPITSTGRGGGTSTFLGTSQASPLAAACAATLLQADPTLTPDEIEAALEASPMLVTDPKTDPDPEQQLSYPRLDCVAALAWLGLTPECANGVDDDGDGLTDFGVDPGCDSAGDVSERGSLVCDNEIDEDGDGWADYPDDPGCASATGSKEDPRCQDGLDNDTDGLVDFDGGESIHGVCGGGSCPPGVSDPDMNGVANPDPQCLTGHGTGERGPGSGCGLGFELTPLLALLAWLNSRRRRQSFSR